MATNEMDAAQRFAILRFSIEQGFFDVESGSKESVFKNLLNRCDQLGETIGIPVSPQRLKLRQRYVTDGNEWIGGELSVGELQQILSKFELIFDTINGIFELDHCQDLDESLKSTFWALKRLRPTCTESRS